MQFCQRCLRPSGSWRNAFVSWLLANLNFEIRAKIFSVLNKFLAMINSSFAVLESLVVFIELTQDGAQLKVSLALVSQFLHFRGNVKSFVVVVFYVFELRYFGLQVKHSAV
jgi:hypothetical protein